MLAVRGGQFVEAPRDTRHGVVGTELHLRAGRVAQAAGERAQQRDRGTGRVARGTPRTRRPTPPAPRTVRPRTRSRSRGSSRSIAASSPSSSPGPRTATTRSRPSAAAIETRTRPSRITSTWSLWSPSRNTGAPRRYRRRVPAARAARHVRARRAGRRTAPRSGAVAMSLGALTERAGLHTRRARDDVVAAACTPHDAGGRRHGARTHREATMTTATTVSCQLRAGLKIVDERRASARATVAAAARGGTVRPAERGNVRASRGGRTPGCAGACPEARRPRTVMVGVRGRGRPGPRRGRSRPAATPADPSRQ